ncbi:MAG TPA: hypothetical protein DEP99_00730 [Nitrospiraceae bacterium]|nr:hypothetical protein [Nitrospiraceae bacterium]
MRNNNKKRWHVAQTKENEFWERAGVLDSQMQRVLTRYAAVIADISKNLPANATILDVGCGPTCAGQLFDIGLKTYLDPLMDSYLLKYQNKLPEGEKICSVAEQIPFPDNNFDVVLCVNALDHMCNPSKALSEMNRVLKKEGMFILGIFLHPAPIAFARRIIEKYLPFLREEAHPYSYTLNSIQEKLSELFLIEQQIKVFRKDTALFPSLHRQDWMFICKKK